MRLALILCLAATAAAADTPMTSEEFEAWSTGRTLDYAIGGQIYGSEMHLPDRRTLDADIGGPCVEGRWFGDGDAICFVYEGDSREHCWHFWRRGDSVLARPVWSEPDSTASEVTVSPTPLQCPGPDVGV